MSPQEQARVSLEACPCLHVEPCDPRCTCVNPMSSRGCERCCSYGSKEQRVAAATRLTALAASAAKVKELEATLTGQRDATERVRHDVGKWHAAHLNSYDEWLKSKAEVDTLTAKLEASERALERVGEIVDERIVREARVRRDAEVPCNSDMAILAIHSQLTSPEARATGEGS